MKRLHREDLYAWSRFDEARDLDFNSVLWHRPEGNVVIDPLPLSAHDRAHIERLGGVALIIVTNSDHARDAAALARETGARVLVPRAERSLLESLVGPPVGEDAQDAASGQSGRGGTLGDGDSAVPGLVAIELSGSKTPGELALLLQDTTLITGDLVRAHEGGRLTLLPEAKRADPAAARRAVARLAALPHVRAVLVGDGYPIFNDGRARLRELLTQR